MDKQPREAREIKLEYSYDRLSVQKIGQAYQLLVPAKTWRAGTSGEKTVEEPAGGNHESSGDICAGLLGGRRIGVRHAIVELGGEIVPWPENRENIFRQHSIM